LAVQTQKATNDVTNQATLLNGLNQSKQSESGVSIDEEMSNMIQFQHAYQANAKVISTLSNLLDVVIGLVQ
jgi:flagellar hook-associated protein 1 FlgK